MNTIDLITNAKTSAVDDNKLYARAIRLLQAVSSQTEGDGSVTRTTVSRINKFLDDNYAQALK